MKIAIASTAGQLAKRAKASRNVPNSKRCITFPRGGVSFTPYDRSSCRIARLEQPLPPPHVAPAVHLPADLAVAADQGEAHRFVQADAPVVRQRDAGERGVVALAKQRQQLGIERAAHALPGISRIDVARDVARGVVSRAVAMRRTIGVARDRAVDFGDQPAVALSVLLHPPRDFGFVGRVELEADPIVGDERRVDGRAAGGVADRVGGADFHRRGVAAGTPRFQPGRTPPANLPATLGGYTTARWTRSNLSRSESGPPPRCARCRAGCAARGSPRRSASATPTPGASSSRWSRSSCWCCWR